MPIVITAYPLSRYKPDYESLELGTGNAQRRDWRGIITALLVIFVICLLIFLCGYIFTPLNANAQDPSHHLLNLTDFKQFRSSTGAPSWLRDGRLVFDSDQGLNIMTVDGNHSVLIAYKEIHDLLQRGASVQCNADCTHVSLYYAAENPSTNPELASNVVNVLDLKTKTLVRVTRQTKQAENINYMQWSPLGKDYLFAQNGHLFYVAEPGLQPVDISTNSKTTTQIHGMFDWMTEEEIFGTKQAIWWSKDGSKIAFASRDSSDEPAITLTAYRAQEKYQIDTKLVYQKTGEKKLPRYTINIWDKATGSTKSMDVQHRDSSAFHYLFGASWIRYGGQEVLAAVWANRWQNETSLTLCDFNTEMCKLVFEFSYPAKTWAMPEEYRNLVSTEDSIFLILPHLQLSSGNIYQHVVRVFEGSRQVLSLGQFDVRSVIRHDAANGLVYFNTMAPRPTSHHLYVTKDVARNSNVFSCVTCSLPNNCSFAVSTFSDSGKRLSIHCRGPTFHRYYQAEVSSKGQLESVKEVLHDVRMEQLVQKTVLPTIIDDTIQLEGGIEASTRLYLPHSRSHLRALPLLVYVYGGPGWQTIDESFSVGYVDYLVTNLHIAVLKIDARGAGGRGWKYRSPIYGALGHAEMEDQIEVTRLALKKYPYLDPNHIAIHGWSYGGFATLRIVEMAPEKMFKCAISGAPVINFQFYDAAYTERYMGSRPKESYVDVSQNNLAKFKTTQLLLIHGLTDDNVHYQNSAIFIEALQNNGIDFDLMVYPNERHHLTAGPKWLHGYTRMTKFLRECLLK